MTVAWRGPTAGNSRTAFAPDALKRGWSLATARHELPAIMCQHDFGTIVLLAGAYPFYKFAFGHDLAPITIFLVSGIVGGLVDGAYAFYVPTCFRPTSDLAALRVAESRQRDFHGG